ncbi:hypothetical protein SAY87_009171 [Trapa incisa]|uniref:Uncharacterized protein n=1 Tax=Trapa incisa TaxID=236973 RepID=A0AAN7JZ63_9MYRT|nr:hypothetical protein SAY87_009171 [Trapa incisa]
MSSVIRPIYYFNAPPLSLCQLRRRSSLDLQHRQRRWRYYAAAILGGGFLVGASDAVRAADRQPDLFVQAFEDLRRQTAIYTLESFPISASASPASSIRWFNLRGRRHDYSRPSIFFHCMLRRQTAIYRLDFIRCGVIVNGCAPWIASTF